MEAIVGNQPVATRGIKTRRIACTIGIVSRDGLFEISPIHAELFLQTGRAVLSETSLNFQAFWPQLSNADCNVRLLL